MQIKALQKEYVQKSRIFIYSILGIRRGVSITPIQTYLTWLGVYTLDDYKLICAYHMRTDKEFKIFEQRVLLKNKYFHSKFELKNKTCVFVFDLTELKKDYDHVIRGEYSYLSDSYKKEVLKFFSTYKQHHTHILSYLEPRLFYKNYSKLLNVNEKLLRDLGELCSLPDLKAEHLDIKKKSINFEATNVNSNQQKRV